MMAYLYKPKRSRIYRARIQLDGEAKLSDVSLHTSDKQVAGRNLSKLVERREKERGGLCTPKRLLDSSQRAVADHLRDYTRELTRLGRDGEYVYNVERLVLRVAKECGWVTTHDVTPDSFRDWRDRQTKAPKTLNEYLGSMCGLLNWLVENERLVDNPLRLVKRIDVRGKETRRRRAYTDDEVRRLLGVAGEWFLVYLTAVLTGLRRGELTGLLWAHLNFQGHQSYLTVPANLSKHRPADTIPLHPRLAMTLRSMRPVDCIPSDRVFPKMPHMGHHDAMLAAAKIEKVDGMGRRADFHALRHTFDTNLARAGVPERLRQALMRHKTFKQTNETYTDVRLLPTVEAIRMLPGLDDGDSRIDSRKLVASSQDASEPVSVPAWLHSAQAPESEDESRGEALPVMMGQSEEDGCRARTRT